MTQLRAADDQKGDATMTSAASGILLAMFGVMMAVMFVIASPTATFIGLRYEQ